MREHCRRPLARRFGALLVTRGRELTKEAFQIKVGKEISDNGFQCLAAQFGSLFRDVEPQQRPYFFFPYELSNRYTIPAYRMRATYSWIAVVGVASAQGNFTNDDLDWSDFIEPPGGMELKSDATTDAAHRR